MDPNYKVMADHGVLCMIEEDTRDRGLNYMTVKLVNLILLISRLL